MRSRRTVIPDRLDRPTIQSNPQSKRGCSSSNRSNLFSRVRVKEAAASMSVCKYRLDRLDRLDEASIDAEFSRSNLPCSVTNVGLRAAKESRGRPARPGHGSSLKVWLCGHDDCGNPLGSGVLVWFVGGASWADRFEVMA